MPPARQAGRGGQPGGVRVGNADGLEPELEPAPRAGIDGVVQAARLIGGHGVPRGATELSRTRAGRDHLVPVRAGTKQVVETLGSVARKQIGDMNAPVAGISLGKRRHIVLRQSEGEGRFGHRPVLPRARRLWEVRPWLARSDCST